MPVNKYIDPVPKSNCELQAKGNMLFSSTAIANGTTTAVVTATGMQTEVGNIHQDLQAAADEDSDTPLKRKLNDFGELLAMVCSCKHFWLSNAPPTPPPNSARFLHSVPVISTSATRLCTPPVAPARVACARRLS